MGCRCTEVGKTFPPNFKPDPWEVELAILADARQCDLPLNLSLSKRYCGTSSVKDAANEPSPSATYLQHPVKQTNGHMTQAVAYTKQSAVF